MDLKNLSMEELATLQKQVNAEMKERGFRPCKGEMGAYEFLVKEFGEEMKSYNSEEMVRIYTDDEEYEEWHRWTYRFETYIFSICDLSLGNYEMKTRKGQKGPTIHNGTSTLKEWVNGKTYKSMVKDIAEVMHKYHKLSKRKEDFQK